MSLATHAGGIYRVPGLPQLILWSTQMHWRHFPNLRGKWRLHDLAMDICERGLARPRARFQRSLTVPVDYSDLVQRELFLHGEYEPETTRELLTLVRPGQTVVDVGANIGYYTLVLAKAVGPGGTVHAFEPVPRLFATLCRNVDSNGFGNVVAEKRACWSAAGEFEIYEAAGGNSGKSSLFEQHAQGIQGHHVQAITIDQYSREKRLDVVNLIKIDVEGAETDVLEGATETIQRCRPILVLEVVPQFLEARGSSLRAFRRLIESWDYDCRLLDLRPTADDWDYGNLLATPRSGTAASPE
jgi:FkbM family methyltransferase